MSLTLQLSLTPYLNLPLQLNQVRPVRLLKLSWSGTNSLENITVRLTSSPQEALQHEWPHLRLEPETQVELPLTMVKLNFDFFNSLGESITGYFVATATSADGEILATASAEARLLPPNHWGGSAAVPELLAAHVMPNDAAVARVMRRAAELLSPQRLALDGYQSGSPQQVGAQVVALLTAFREQDVYYAMPPRSFERYGQRIRTPAEVLTDGLGTCLDLACLFAAVLEQAGLHAGIVLQEEHAFTVCWLQPSPVQPQSTLQAQDLRKALAAGLLLAVETTALVGAEANVNQSLQAGRVALDRDAEFVALVDLMTARLSHGVRPLGQARQEQQAVDRKTTATRALDLSAIQALPTQLQEEEEPVERGAARVDTWKKRLLDLTRRNRLLNWRKLRSNLLLPYIDAAALEDALASGTTFRFDSLDISRGRGAVLERDLSPEHHAAAVRQALGSGVLLVPETASELLKTLLLLERNARTSVEEGGANTLYLALGFAVKRSGGSDAAIEYRAPLILLPVELRRRRAGNSFSLARRDEEALLNPTLQELLRREHGVTFSGLTEELPTDDAGLDVPMILHTARQVLLNLPLWEVLEDVALGEFSFSKYLMWRDLDRFEEHLRENPVVAHLIERPREPYHVPEAGVQVFPEREQLDHTFPVAQMLTPLSADASQLAAVRAASLGLDFVLEGPPGTGKSQTITNLIAQCLGEGRSVLFVSEKTAALEVVERRLNDIGLGEFCLELHSNKVSKTHVYEQLRAAWTAEAASSHDWAAEAERLGMLRDELGAVVEALHQSRPIGWSVFEGMNLALHPAAAQAPAPAVSWVQQLDEAGLRRGMDIARQLGVTLDDVPTEAQLDLRVVEGPFEPTALKQGAQEVVQAGASFAAAREAFAGNVLGAGGAGDTDTRRGSGDASLTALALVDELAELLEQAKGKNYVSLAEAVEGGRARRNLLEQAKLLVELQQAFQQLNATYRPEVVELPAETMLTKWRRAEAKWILQKWWEQRALRRDLQGYVTSGEVDQVEQELALLTRIGALRQNLLGLAGGVPQLEASALAAAADMAAYAQRWVGFAEKASALKLNRDRATAWFEALDKDNEVARELLRQAQAYRAGYKRLQQAAGGFAEALGVAANAKAAPPLWDAAADWPTTLKRLAESVLRQEHHWRSWSFFAAARRESQAHGLAYFAESLLGQPPVGGPRAARQFELGVARVWTASAIAAEPVLAGFGGSLHNDRITRFRALDQQISQTAQAEIRARLLARRQRLYTQEMRPHLAVWNNERDKKRQQLPVRPLIERLGPLLTELTPCLLMSPLSVAQYLPADRAIRFDLVVFDEASQIPVWDAVGAIARGRQVIVVGDSKQLPPTSFFEKVDADGGELRSTEGDDVVVEDMESILDEMRSASLLSRRLRWHYRSRAESLIAFSNQTYYDGELATFPAPVAEDQAVAYHPVESRAYASGRNAVEAEALVAYLVARLCDPAVGETTFGVVTFGTTQQTLILDLLEQARTQHPELDRHFDPDRDERVFVKNIENVQGDERDVILFSITYGPDANGKLAMRFGPMNQAGGERRLNVAVTRARREMHVFTSIEPEQIDLARLGDNADGARDLRRFLEFARRGARRAAASSATSPAAEVQDKELLLAQVVDMLRAADYEVDTQVGVSGYRVDIAVRDERESGRYLVGIELDGDSYLSGATVRERDVLRQSVLRGLGWRLLRVWSLEWWHDRERVSKRLLADIAELRDAPGDVQLQENTIHEAAVAPAVASRPASVSPPTSPAPVADVAEPLSLDGAPFGKTEGAAVYTLLRAADFADLRDSLGFDLTLQYFDRQADKAVRQIAQRVVETESPLLLEEASRRVALAGCEIARASVRVLERSGAQVRQVGVVKKLAGEELVFRDAAQAAAPLVWRAPSGAASRGIPEIPLVELAALAKELLPLGLDGDALIREMGARIGLGSVRGSSRQRVERAVELAWAGN